MSKPKDSEDLVRVGPGTAMGDLMRQYWMPAAMSSELVRDGAPMRLMLLGEQLIAFRDSSAGSASWTIAARIAALRCSSAATRKTGIRCVYHGWKYDVAGNCVDMPNVPAEQDFKERSRPRPTRWPSATALSGSIWASARRRRRCRASRPRCCRRTNCRSSSSQRECNWLQALEGDIDTSHFGFLHVGSRRPADMPDDN